MSVAEFSIKRPVTAVMFFISLFVIGLIAAIRLPLPEGFWLQAGIVAASIAVMVGLSVNSSLRQHRRATVWISSMSLLILIGLFVGYPYLSALDQGVMTLVQEHRQPMLDEIAVTLTLIGEFHNMLMFSALLTGLLLLCRQWRQAIFAGGTLLCTALLNTVTKQFFARVRPEVLTDPLTSYSMPSGHASGSFALFLVLAVLAGRGQPPRMRLTWLLLGCIPALSIALSRVYLGAHWLSDIVGGMLLGIVWLLVLGIAYRRHVERSFWMRPVAAIFYITFAVAALWHAPRAVDPLLAKFAPKS